MKSAQQSAEVESHQLRGESATGDQLPGQPSERLDSAQRPPNFAAARPLYQRTADAAATGIPLTNSLNWNDEGSCR